MQRLRLHASMYPSFLTKFLSFLGAPSKLPCFSIHQSSIHSLFSGSDNYIVSKTSRGKPCILMDGYKYLCHILNKRCPTKYWQCDRYSGKQPCCKVRAVMREDGKFCPNGFHSHPPNPSLIRLQEKICFENSCSF